MVIYCFFTFYYVVQCPVFYMMYNNEPLAVGVRICCCSCKNKLKKEKNHKKGATVVTEKISVAIVKDSVFFQISLATTTIIYEYSVRSLYQLLRLY